jgi:hypothetical protein
MSEIASAVPIINVARIATTDSLSSLSRLEYHVGYEASDPDQIFFRIWKNSGAGKHSNHWIGLSEVEKALSGIPPEGTFTAAALAPIAEGKSVNTASFIGAALLAEGLIVRSEKVARSYERNPNTAVWWSELRKLIEAKTALDVPPITKPVAHSSSSAGQGKSGRKQKSTLVAANPVE